MVNLSTWPHTKKSMGFKFRGVRRPEVRANHVKTLIGQELDALAAGVAGGGVLLPHPRAVSDDSMDPGDDHSPHEVDVVVGLDPEALGEDVGGMTSPSLLTTPNTMTVAGNFVFMTLGTSFGRH